MAAPVAEVKTKWYDAAGLERGTFPSNNAACPAGEPAQPTEAEIQKTVKQYLADNFERFRTGA